MSAIKIVTGLKEARIVAMYHRHKSEYEIARDLQLSITKVKIVLRKYKSRQAVNSVIRMTKPVKLCAVKVKAFLERVFKILYNTKLRIKLVEVTDINFTKNL